MLKHSQMKKKKGREYLLNMDGDEVNKNVNESLGFFLASSGLNLYFYGWNYV
jgi:hypothetical protein